ncbi:MAG: glycerol-3-phosphate 1-O-acyltransferase PlsY [Treponema sp.]|nr:glycerol-3-phosphate 1-O-acyltransferase PlsY [Treponema sp.]
MSKLAITLLYVICALVPYLIAGVNPAILLARLIYHEDIREKGSGNPGFTNFKRVYGNKYAWFVFILDISKGVLLCLAAGYAFRSITGQFHLGAAYAGFFAMLGHSYPVWYKFKGGKGFLVACSAIWFMDWRVALIAMCIFLILLFTVKYMSLCTMIAAWLCPVMLAYPFGFYKPITGNAFNAEHIGMIFICTASVTLMTWRHKENIKRLAAGTESKFSLGGKNKKTEESEKTESSE